MQGVIEETFYKGPRNTSETFIYFIIFSMSLSNIHGRFLIVLAICILSISLPMLAGAQPLIEAELYLDHGALGAASSSGDFDQAGIQEESDEVSATGTNTIVVTRLDIESGATVLDEPLSVSSVMDFLAYARSVIDEDDNVLRIEAGDDNVSLWYRIPARFFGIIPSEVSAKVSVQKSGAVSIEHPWWHGFFYTEDIGSSIENDLSNTAGTIARTDEGEIFSSNTKARLLNALHSVLRAHLSGEVRMGLGL